MKKIIIRERTETKALGKLTEFKEEMVFDFKSSMHKRFLDRSFQAELKDGKVVLIHPDNEFTAEEKELIRIYLEGGDTNGL